MTWVLKKLKINQQQKNKRSWEVRIICMITWWESQSLKHRRNRKYLKPLCMLLESIKTIDFKNTSYSEKKIINNNQLTTEKDDQDMRI